MSSRALSDLAHWRLSPTTLMTKTCTCGSMTCLPCKACPISLALFLEAPGNATRKHALLSLSISLLAIGLAWAP
eukprot:10844689-Alexandrium_andersonii.AAC.1